MRRSLHSCLHPSHFFDLMKAELENQPKKMTRESFLPIFIVNLLQDSLVGATSESTSGPDDKDICTQSPNDFDEKESNDYSEDSFCYLLSKAQRTFVEKILIFALNAKDHPGLGLNVPQLTGQFCLQIEFPCLELVWLLDSKFKLMSVGAYLMRAKSTNQMEYFSKQFVNFCFSSCLHEDSSSGKAVEILNDLLRSILLSAYCNPDLNNTLTTLKVACNNIMNQITRRLNAEDSIQSSLNHKFLIAILQGVPILDSLKKRYFSSQLSMLLKEPSKQTLEATLQHQEKFAANDPEKQRKLDTIALFLGYPQRKNDVIDVLHKNLKKLAKLNWENVLYTITTWEKIDPDVSYEIFLLMRDLIRALMLIGLNDERDDEITVSFILARHCCLISPHHFSRYEKWFTSMFEHENSTIAKTPAKFTFLVQVLTRWVPHEPPCFLQVHVSYRPFIPVGCREIWNDYISLAKARIVEYNEIEEAMEYEPNPNNPVQYDVEMAIKSYDKLKKIPQTIQEMLLFRKPYYKEHFLPALVKKPPGTIVSDARLRLIETLNQEGKIPAELYLAYKTNFQG